MGIKSTSYVTRESAISRILEVDGLLCQKHYRALEATTSEHNYDLEAFVDSTEPLNVTHGCLSRWTDTMLEDKLDEPFYRWSMFDNYYIREDAGEDAT